MPDVFVAQENIQQKPVTATQLESSLHHAGMFATYCKNPENVRFGTQEPEEKILLFLRRDFITNVPWILSSLLLTISPTLIGSLSGLTNIQIITFSSGFSFIFSSIYYVFVLTYIFVNFITWYFNVSLLTNIRVMDVDFENLIYKQISETKLSLVQDVSYKQIGAIQTFYDYGDVLIQTAAPVDSFILTAVPQPQKVVETVENLIGRGIVTHGI